MKEYNKEQIIIFGTGGGYRNALLNGFFEQYDVAAVADSNSRLQGFITAGHCIIAPDQINDYNYNYIYITSEKYYQEIQHQLVDHYKIDRKKIRLAEQRTSYRDSEKEKKELQCLRNAIIEVRLDNFKKNGVMVEIAGSMTNGNEISSYWNAHTVHDNWFVSAQESYEYCLERFNMYPKFREFAQMDRSHEEDVILDYGCGPGNDLTWLKLNGKAKHIIGMDVSRAALENAQFRLALHHINNSDAELVQIGETEDKIPLEDNSIDFINCQGVLMHTSNPPKIVKEFYRVIKKQSDKPCASIMVYNKDSIWYHLYAAYYLRYVDNMIFADFGMDKTSKMSVDDIFVCSTDGIRCPKAACWTEEEFIGILKNAGFSRIEYQGGYPDNMELGIAKKYIYQAIEDCRLEEVHKEFLRNVSFNEEGYPVYNGKLCGVGGVYICYV